MAKKVVNYLKSCLWLGTQVKTKFSTHRFYGWARSGGNYKSIILMAIVGEENYEETRTLDSIHNKIQETRFQRRWKGNISSSSPSLARWKLLPCWEQKCCEPFCAFRYERNFLWSFSHKQINIEAPNNETRWKGELDKPLKFDHLSPFPS